jgi:hypothetical protein
MDGTAILQTTMDGTAILRTTMDGTAMPLGTTMDGTAILRTTMDGTAILQTTMDGTAMPLGTTMGNGTTATVTAVLGTTTATVMVKTERNYVPMFQNVEMWNASQIWGINFICRKLDNSAITL